MRFISQLGLLVGGLADSFSWVCIFIALMPFIFILKMQKRERSWIIGLTAIYFCIGVLLTIFMDMSLDRHFRIEQGFLHRVARDVRHHDRLRPGADGRLHGHALPEISGAGECWAAAWP